MRQRFWQRSGYATAIAAVTACLVVSLASSAAAQNEAAVTMRMEAEGQPPMDMQFFVGEGRLRMDTPQGMTMIWTGDSMLMVQHEQKSYMEWGQEQMRMMEQLMSKMPQGAGGREPPALDPGRIGFRETGRRERIGDWDAFEVEMTGLPEGQAGALWMTRDLETGMLQIVAGIGSSLMTMPMFGGGAGPGQEMTRYRELADAVGLPAGQVVRIASSEAGRTTTMTLTDIEPGPLPDGTFAAPAGYSEMQMPQMPMMPGR